MTAEYYSFLASIGFVICAASTCSFWHKERELHLSVHGDDFTIAGPEESLIWHEAQMKNKFRWTAIGIEHEPDQRHAEIIIKDMGVVGT